MGRGTIMVRTMLFAFASLVGVGTMVVMEVGTPPRAAIRASEPLAPSTIGIGGSHDTLTKADRLEVTYLRNDVPIQPILPAQLVSPVESIPVGSQPAPNLINQHGHDPNSRKLAVVLPRPRPRSTTKIESKITTKITTKIATKIPTKIPTKMATKIATNSPAKSIKSATNTDRSKLAVEAKPCQSNAFGSLLKVLNLSSGCQT